jgi:hypothetical protein
MDIKTESTPLSISERKTLKDATDHLNKLRRDEETKWAQRAKVKHVHEYFHLTANGKHRNKKNISIRERRRDYSWGRNLKVYITEYYKKLFGDPVANSFSLMEEGIEDIP